MTNGNSFAASTNTAACDKMCLGSERNAESRCHGPYVSV
jgi:hypothetical protein